MDGMARVIVVEGESVGIRAGKSETALVGANVPVGELVEVVYLDGDWARVEYEGKLGWMLQKSLKSVPGEREAVPFEPDASLMALLDEGDKALEKLSDVLTQIRGRG